MEKSKRPFVRSLSRSLFALKFRFSRFASHSTFLSSSPIASILYFAAPLFFASVTGSFQDCPSSKLFTFFFFSLACASAAAFLLFAPKISIHVNIEKLFSDPLTKWWNRIFSARICALCFELPAHWKMVRRRLCVCVYSRHIYEFYFHRRPCGVQFWAVGVCGGRWPKYNFSHS